jgi:2-polyprenyl-3-methyl-5-hydroxy-6-metoxy-1,4-benzoquinol methylase
MLNNYKKIFSYHNWRQKNQLENNISTPGRVDAGLWNFIGLPSTLAGKSFIDVGANDGLFSFIAEQKGAKKIVASDLYKDNIDSMKNGWSKEGILLLMDYFKSKIYLDEKGIYFLHELGFKFDIVLLNDVINWLQDIDLALDNLRQVTEKGGVLYLSDGFLTDNSKPLKKVLTDSGLRHMYNLKYVTNLLGKYGFKIISIDELNYQKIFIKDYLTTPNIIIKEGTKIFNWPESLSDYNISEGINAKGDGFFQDYIHIYGIGWVYRHDVTVYFNKPSIYYKLSDILYVQSIYYKYLNYKYKKHRGVTAFSIKAKKI